MGLALRKLMLELLAVSLAFPALILELSNALFQSGHLRPQPVNNICLLPLPMLPVPHLLIPLLPALLQLLLHLLELLPETAHFCLLQMPLMLFLGQLLRQLHGLSLARIQNIHLVLQVLDGAVGLRELLLGYAQRVGGLVKRTSCAG